MPAQVAVRVEKQSSSYKVHVSVEHVAGDSSDELSMIWCAHMPASVHCVHVFASMPASHAASFMAACILPQHPCFFSTCWYIDVHAS